MRKKDQKSGLKTMKWTDKKIVEWHHATFPDVDLKSQILKFLEEYREYLESGDIMELADIVIVNVVLISRFNFMGFVDIIKDEALTVYPALLKAVDLKMEINRKRKWHKVRGVYRHKEGK